MVRSTSWTLPVKVQGNVRRDVLIGRPQAVRHETDGPGSSWFLEGGGE